MVKVPVVYAYLYMKIKDNNKTSIIRIVPLKEIVARNIIRNGGILDL